MIAEQPQPVLTHAFAQRGVVDAFPFLPGKDEQPYFSGVFVELYRPGRLGGVGKGEHP